MLILLCSQLTLILSDPTKLRQECEADTASKYLSMNGSDNVITEALEEIICFDLDTWQQVIKDKIRQEEFENKVNLDLFFQYLQSICAV